jgi:RNA polymerase sigma-70 factor, ECF subfamily
VASTQAFQGALSTDRAAQFKRMFEAEFGYVWGSLHRLGVHPSNVEDVTHDVFLQVYSKLNAYDPARPIRPWLFGFAFRAASEYRREARHRREVMGVDHDAIHSGPTPEAAVGTAEEGQLVMTALTLVPVERRAVLIAYELDAMPMKEIAASLEIPLHTAYSRLRVAREEFAAAIRSLEAPQSRHEERPNHE